MTGGAWWPGEAEVRMREAEEARREHGPECRGCEPACDSCPESEATVEYPGVHASPGLVPALRIGRISGSRVGVSPCRRCGATDYPHSRGCFWSLGSRGAVPGMRYAWAPREAPLGDTIERQEDEIAELQREAARLRRRVRERGWSVVAAVAGGVIAMVLNALEVSPWA